MIFIPFNCCNYVGCVLRVCQPILRTACSTVSRLLDPAKKYSVAIEKVKTSMPRTMVNLNSWQLFIPYHPLEGIISVS